MNMKYVFTDISSITATTSTVPISKVHSTSICKKIEINEQPKIGQIQLLNVPPPRSSRSLSRR